MNETVGGRIAQLRKEKGMTQEQLANALGITFQAVSKWENGVSSPDISALPLLAELFGVSIDRLFGREREERAEKPEEALVPAPVEQKNGAPYGELPWADDNTLHAVLFIGHRLAGHGDVNDRPPAAKKIEFYYDGPALNVQSDFDLHVEGDVQGNVSAGGDVSCNGVGGDVNAEGDVNCGDVMGHLTAAGDVDCGEVMGNLQAGGDVDCRDVQGSVSAGGDVDCGEVMGRSVSAAGEEFHSKHADKKRGFSFELKL